MSKTDIPLFRIAWSEEDVESVARRIRSGMFWAVGPEIGEFEKAVASYVGAKHAVAFSSGTSATHAAFLAYGIKTGDEVIVPSFTFISTANSVLFVNAKPVFAEIEEETCALDVESVKEKITSRTKAIMPVHYAGLPARDTRAITEYARDKKILVIEDAAEALGSKLDGTMLGRFGDSAMYSFCSNKVISTGEGGMIVSDDEKFAQQLRLLCSHGRLDKQNYFATSLPPDYVQLGYNFRMPTLCAALGVSQMKRIETYIAKRNEIAHAYARLLLNTGIKMFAAPKNSRCVFQLFPILLKTKEDKEKVKEALVKNGVMCKTYFDPIHTSHFYKHVLKYSDSLPITEDVSSRILNIPMYPDLNLQEVETITQIIKGAL